MDENVTNAFFAEQMSDEANQVCIDCTAGKPQWASVSLGSYFCMQCSGRHRSLGSHISFVRSMSMDAWKESQLKRMQHGGNARLKALLDRYELSQLPIEEKYRTRAAEYYRQHLAALADGKASPQEPSLDDGVMFDTPAMPSMTSGPSNIKILPFEGGPAAPQGQGVTGAGHLAAVGRLAGDTILSGCSVAAGYVEQLRQSEAADNLGSGLESFLWGQRSRETAISKGSSHQASTVITSAHGERSAASEALESLPIGSRVQLCGLQTAQHLNGQLGEVVGFDEGKLRYRILLLMSDGGDIKRLKRGNLETVSVPK